MPHPACALPIMTAQAYFFCQQILTHDKILIGADYPHHEGTKDL